MSSSTYGSWMSRSPTAFNTLLCSTVSKAFCEADDCDPQRLVPLGGCLSLSELLERGKVVSRGEAWSEACLVSGLVGVQRGLSSLENEPTEEVVQDGDRSNGSVVRW